MSFEYICTILFVDDDKVLSYLFKRSFGKYFDIVFARDANEAIEILNSRQVHIILSDHHLPGKTGIDLLKIVKDKYPEIIRIFVTGSESIEIREEAEKECGISHFIAKPWDVDNLMEVLKTSAEKNFNDGSPDITPD